MATRPSRLTRQQWLNIVILVISALILMFVIIGRVMDREPPEPSHANELQVVLQRIDFGDITLFQKNEKWASSSEQVSAQRAAEIAFNWRRLVARSGDDYGEQVPLGKTVLLYFSHIPQPVVGKVDLTDEHLTITFITSKQQFHLAKTDYSLYIPGVD